MADNVAEDAVRCGLVLFVVDATPLPICRLRNNIESSFGVKNSRVIETEDRDNVSLVTQLGNDAWVGNRGLKIRAAA